MSWLLITSSRLFHSHFRSDFYLFWRIKDQFFGPVNKISAILRQFWHDHMSNHRPEGIDPSKLRIQIHTLSHDLHPVESELPESPAKAGGHCVDLEVRLPVVLSHLELREDLSVRLSLRVFPQYLARPHHPLVRVLVNGELCKEQFVVLYIVASAVFYIIISYFIII